MTYSLKNKTIFISGGSRGIGLAIALRAAKEGANIAIAAKTHTPHPKLEGTIHTAADQIREVGGQALPLICDIRDEPQIEQAVKQTISTFGGIDICINNASAVKLTKIRDTPAKRFDLMHEVNVRGTFLVIQKCLPHLLKAENPHILSLSPPINIKNKWFAPHTAYTCSKYGMSLITLGASCEYRGRIGINTLWPRTMINTAAMKEFNFEKGAAMRSPEIIAEAAYRIFHSDAKQTTGNFFVDDELLESYGLTDLSKYKPSGVQDEDLVPDLFVPSLKERNSVIQTINNAKTEH